MTKYYISMINEEGYEVAKTDLFNSFPEIEKEYSKYCLALFFESDTKLDFNDVDFMIRKKIVSENIIYKDDMRTEEEGQPIVNEFMKKAFDNYCLKILNDVEVTGLYGEQSIHNLHMSFLFIKKIINKTLFVQTKLSTDKINFLNNKILSTLKDSGLSDVDSAYLHQMIILALVFILDLGIEREFYEENLNICNFIKHNLPGQEIIDFKNIEKLLNL